MVRYIIACFLSLCIALPAVAAEKEAKQLFGAKRTPSKQAPASFGGYAKGCQAGAAQLPETGPTWQAMRLSRNPLTIFVNYLPLPPGYRGGGGFISAIFPNRGVDRC